MVRLELTEVIPPVERPQDTAYVNILRIESPLLSAFWGRPMELGAVVLLPPGFAEHPDARYPVLYYQGHFQPACHPGQLRPQPPEAELTGYARTVAEKSYAFYQDWTSAGCPRC